MTKLSEQFRSYLDEMHLYHQALILFQWDLQTGAPENGMENKTKAMTYFSDKEFAMSTAPEYGEMLEKLSQPEEYDQLDEAMKLTVTRYKKDYDRFVRVPADFYSTYVETSIRSEKTWEKAKQTSDYGLFAPWLEKMINLTKQLYAYTNPSEECYDAMLNQYEAGMTSEVIDELFDEMKEGLKPLLAKIAASPQPDPEIVNGYYDIDKQKKVQDLLLEYIGFNFKSGATGESEHPFTDTLTYGDTRVTNHYNTVEPINAFFSSIHEGGHAIFEQNIRPEYAGTAAAEVNMMGLHESQSRFCENILGRRKSFWIPVYDKICEILPELKKVSLDEFDSVINYVHPNFIRCDADEVTYCLHIILRYEMEKAIFRGNIPVEELPALWNQKSEELLGIVPSNDAEGILQDMHWSDASFGYFPSYLLGTIYDGMYLDAIEKDLGNVDELLAAGRVKEITGWLTEHIHQYGSMYTSKEVLERIGEGKVSAKPILKYFNEKYAKVYGWEN